MTNKIKDVNLHKIVYKKSKVQKWDFKNQRTFEDYYYRLKMLAISVFEWKNLPDGIDTDYMERVLYEQGKVIVFQEPDMINENKSPFLALRVALNGKLNVYGIPMYRKAYASNGYTKLLNYKNSEIIFDNTLHISIDEMIYEYAERLATVERIIDVNLNNTRHPYVILTNEKQKKQLEEIMSDINSNKPLIILDDSIESFKNKTEIFGVDGKFVVDKLMDYKHSLLNEVLTFIGIGNSSQDKRDRLLTSEMENVSDLNQAYSAIRLKARLRSLDKIKKMFEDTGEWENVEVCFALNPLQEQEVLENVKELTDGNTSGKSSEAIDRKK